MHLWRKPGSWRSAFERILKWHYLKCPHDFVYSLGNNKWVFNIPLRDRTKTINTISTFKNKFPGFSFSPKSSSSPISSSSLLKTTLLFKTQGPNIVNLQGFIVSILSQSQEKCNGFWSCFPRDQSLSDLLFSKIKKKALRFLQHQATFNCTLWSRAAAVNIFRVTVNCFPFDVKVFAMLPAHGIWRETVSLLDVMWP